MGISARRHRRQGIGATIEYGLIAVMLCAAIVAAVFALRSAVSVADPDTAAVALSAAAVSGAIDR